MFGIVSNIGPKDTVPILLKGLRRLEYPGYDSAGIALLNKNNRHCSKKARKFFYLESVIDDSAIYGFCGIAHTG